MYSICVFSFISYVPDLFFCFPYNHEIGRKVLEPSIICGLSPELRMPTPHCLFHITRQFVSLFGVVYSSRREVTNRVVFGVITCPEGRNYGAPYRTIL